MDKEKLIEELKIDEIKKDEIKKDDEIIEKDINIIIQKNNAIFVDKISKRDKKIWGKIAYWYDFLTDKSICIIDQDYWRSKELIRALLEDDVEEWSTFKKILYSLMILIVAVIVVALLYFIWVKIFDSKTETNIPIKTNIPIIQENKIQNIPWSINNTWTWNINNFDNNINLSKKQEIKTETKVENINYELETIKMKCEFEKQTILMEKNECLTRNNNFTFELTELKEKNKNLSLEIEQNKEKLKNLSKEDFFYYLGHKVFEECENKKSEYCKTLYYEFLNYEK